MTAPPYMKLYVADYLGDTHHLNAREHGAYLLLLMGMWRAGGKLPANDAKLARLARCTAEEWADVRATVLEFFTRAGGSLKHKRLAEELAKYEGVVEKRKAASEKAVAEKRRKNNSKAAPNGQPSADHLATKPEPEPEPEVIAVAAIGADAPDDWPEGRLVDELVRLADSPRLDPHKSPGLITTAGRLVAWRRDGASWEHDVVPAVTTLARKRGPPIATWKFFDGAVAQSIADNRQALVLPEANTHERSHADRRRAAYLERLADVDEAMGAAFEQPARRNGTG